VSDFVRYVNPTVDERDTSIGNLAISLEQIPSNHLDSLHCAVIVFLHICWSVH